MALQTWSTGGMSRDDENPGLEALEERFEAAPQFDFADPVRASVV